MAVIFGSSYVNSPTTNPGNVKFHENHAVTCQYKTDYGHRRNETAKSGVVVTLFESIHDVHETTTLFLGYTK